jgi:hypothetical protein
VFEAIVVGAAVAGTIAMLGRRQSAASTPLAAGRWSLRNFADQSVDLPCPWCRAATTESDTHCPNCHQRFG